MKQRYGKKITTLVAIFLFALMQLITPVNTQNEIFAASDDLTIYYSGLAGEIAKNIGTGWNLGNTLDAHGSWSSGSAYNFETSWGNPVTTKQMIDTLKAAGFNAIRVPVTWYQHVNDSNGYAIDSEWMNRVQQVVDYVIDNDMYCIINVHHDTGESGWLRATDSCYNNYKNKFSAIWRQIATRFEGYSNKLLFEGFNEMLNDSNTWGYAGTEANTTVNKWNQLFVDTVRATGGNNAERCLIVNTYCASAESAVLDEFVLPTDSAEDSLIVEVHYYNPWTYCNTMSDTTPETDWRNNNGEETVTAGLYSFYTHFTSKGIPVIIGEIAAADKNNTANRVDYASYVFENACKYGIKCFWWDDGGSFSIFNRSSLQFKFPEIATAIVNATKTNYIVLDNAETPSTSTAPVVSETPSTTPVVTESPTVSSSAPVGTVPSVSVTNNINSGVSQVYTIGSANGAIDLSKVKLVFSYAKDGNESDTFWCDSAAITYQSAPYYANYGSYVVSTISNKTLTLEFSKSETISDGAYLTIQSRLTNSNWANYSNFEADKLDVYYDGSLCETIEF